MQKFLQETIEHKQNQNLVKWVEDCENHYAKLEDYIKSQKFNIENDLQLI